MKPSDNPNVKTVPVFLGGLLHGTLVPDVPGPLRGVYPLEGDGYQNDADGLQAEAYRRVKYAPWRGVTKAVAAWVLCGLTEDQQAALVWDALVGYASSYDGALV